MIMCNIFSLAHLTVNEKYNVTANILITRWCMSAISIKILETAQCRDKRT